MMKALIVLFGCFFYPVFCQSLNECFHCDEGKDSCIQNATACITCVDPYWGGKCKETCPSQCIACEKEAVRSGQWPAPILYHVCTKCIDGYYLGDTNETKSCNLSCPIGCKTCTSVSNCGACKSGYFSENEQCSACSTNCVACTSKSECTSCTDGYYGQVCDLRCSTDCQYGFCDTASNTCKCTTGFGGAKCDSCLDTFYMYGSNCIRCSNACLDQKCNKGTGYCDNGCASKNNTGLFCENCVNGTFGSLCDISCSNNCKGNTCKRNSGDCYSCVENFSGDKCNSCVPGKHGLDCTKNCSTNCKSKECFQVNGTCVHCNVGFMGSSCDQCSAGLYSENCSLPCLSENCLGNLCNRTSGLCKVNELCAVGWYGENCNDKCSDGCKYGHCNRENSSCFDGCVENYSGDKCCVQNANCLQCSSTKDCAACFSGYYGTDCNLTCSENCTDGCLKSSGECTGCVNDTYDLFCNGTCSDTCRPKENGRRCNERSGECLVGCEEGFYGTTCSYKCADTCDDQTCALESRACHTQASANLQRIGPVVGGALGGVVIIVVVIAVVLLYKRRKPLSKSENTDNDFTNSDDLETRLTVGKEVAKKEKTSTGRKSKHKNIASKRNEGLEMPYELEDPNEDKAAEQDVFYANLPIKVDHNKEKMKVKVSELYGYVQQKSTEQYNKEFKSLPVGIRKPCEMARRLNNIKKNRYTGIRPYDETRVTIKDDPEFFINANYIKGFNTDKRYIATFGPTKETTEDFKTFWQMVWHEKSDIIVMLTNLQEKSKMKCEQYWPDFEKHATYGNITVECYNEEIFAEYTMRLFTISRKEEKRPLTQFHYTAWPDQGVPDLVVSLIEFWQRVKSCAKLNQGPDIIHCSAGIGRTGTFIAIDILTQEGKAEDAVNVYDCILEMREQRVGMVQTPEQFVYLHKALVYTHVFECEAISLETFQEYVESSSNAVFAHHFQLLHKTIEDEKDEEKEAKKRNAMYKTKNRPGADIPGDFNRPTLHFSKSSHDPDYINATFIDSLKRKNSFIVAQTPLPLTLEDFVCLLYQEECSCVVSLEESVNRQDVGEYLPADNQSLTVGHFIVTSTRCESKPMYMTRELTIRYSNEPKKTMTMYHYQYTGWPKGKYYPEDAQQFLQFINDVKWMAATGKTAGDSKPIVVHCLNASSRCGLFCVVAVVIEKLQAERQVSIPNTIRQIRTRRHGAIANKEQFEFCYRCAAAYLAQFDMYKNFIP